MLAPPTSPRSTATGDLVRVRRTDLLGGLELVEARFVRRSTAPHSHPEVEIGVIAAGQRRVRCHDRTYHGQAGSIVVFRPGEVHAGSPVSADGATYRSFVVPLAVLAAQCGWTGPAWFATPVLFDPPLATSLTQAHQRGNAAADDQLREALTRLGARYRANPTGGPVIPEGIRRVRDYLDTHYATAVRLSELSAIARLSVFHLIRVFRAATGLPPYAYLTQVRIDRAAALLRAGRPVSQVAFVTGFADQSHLTRIFKRLVGVPPGQYQRHTMDAKTG